MIPAQKKAAFLFILCSLVMLFPKYIWAGCRDGRGTCQHRQAVMAVLGHPSRPAELVSDNVIRVRYPIAFDIQPNIEQCVSMRDLELRLERAGGFRAEGTVQGECIHAWLTKNETLTFQAWDSRGPIGTPLVVLFTADGKGGNRTKVTYIPNTSVPFDQVESFHVIRRDIDVMLDD